MAKKTDPFAALMTTAQDQQRYFTTKQAIESGYADNTHPYHVKAGNWERVWRGIYRMAHLPPLEDGEMMVWLLWSRGSDSSSIPTLASSLFGGFLRRLCKVVPVTAHYSADLRGVAISLRPSMVKSRSV